MNIVCYGQTLVGPGASIDDPESNCAGVENEVITALGVPYQVPKGKKLALGPYAIEGQDNPPCTLIFPWLGNYPPECNTAAEQTDYRITHALMSCASRGGSRELLGFRPVLPPGTVVHWRIQNGGAVGKVLAWYWSGELTDA